MKDISENDEMDMEMDVIEELTRPDSAAVSESSHKNVSPRTFTNPLSSIANGVRRFSNALVFGSSATAILNKMARRRHSTTVSPKGDFEDTGELFCKVLDNPHRILKLASSGKLKELEALVLKNPEKLEHRDKKGRGPFHHATYTSRTAVMEFLLAYECDINAKDNDGNTPLHVAIEKNQEESVKWLLLHGADSSIANNAKMAPIHHSVWLNSPEMLTALIKYGQNSIDLHQAGDHGAPPLHYAAYADNRECAAILLENGARLCAPCSNGVYAIHVAVKQLSVGVLDLMLGHVEDLGYETSKVLAWQDNDKKTPLHCSVLAGNFKAVQLCLSWKAPIDSLDANGATPVHLACALGELEMVKAMFDGDPDRLKAIFRLGDVQEMTLLHVAALYDHWKIVKYLLEISKDTLEVRDQQGHTALLKAVTKQATESMRLLFNAGANMLAKDNENRNFVHLAVLNGCKLKDFECYFKELADELLNQKDDHGCTPLHYASMNGMIATLDQLLNLGAHVKVQNNDRLLPLHFAARYGRYNSVKKFLNSPQGSYILNETDNHGFTALHHASINGHDRVVRLLLHKGASAATTYKSENAVHLAALNGHCRTIKTLLGVYSQFRDMQNKDGDTPLHVAAKANQAGSVALLMTMGAEFILNGEGKTFLECAIELGFEDTAKTVVLHDRWQEALQIKGSGMFSCPVMEMVLYLPQILRIILDRSITISSLPSNHKDYFEHYDFTYLQAPVEYIKDQRKKGREVAPMFPLQYMVQNRRIECLTHPVVLRFLWIKWKNYGLWFHLFNLFIYIMFLGSLTSLACEKALRTARVESADLDCYEGKITSFSFACIILTLVFCSLNIVKENIQIYQQKMQYFYDWTNYLEWALYLSSIVFVTPFLVRNCHIIDVELQWQSCAVAVFLAWFNLMLYLRRFDKLGIYVVMFMEIFRTLIMALLVFWILIAAFGFAFYILLDFNGITTIGVPEIKANQKDSNESLNRFRAYGNPGVSFLTTSIMLLGEIGFVDNFLLPSMNRNIPLSWLTFIFLVMFVLLMPILLMNLLIGLAVGDIESVQRNATLKRLAMQIDHHVDIEKKMPLFILERVCKGSYTHYPNHTCIKAILGKLARFFNDSSASKSSVDIIDFDSSLAQTAEATNHELYELNEGLAKTKRRMKEIASKCDKQYELLRLIVQKMDITFEADDLDEGESLSEMTDVTSISGLKIHVDDNESAKLLKPDSAGSKGRTRSRLKTVVTQHSVVNQLKKTVDLNKDEL